MQVSTRTDDKGVERPLIDVPLDGGGVSFDIAVGGSMVVRVNVFGMHDGWANVDLIPQTSGQRTRILGWTGPGTRVVGPQDQSTYALEFLRPGA